MLGDLPVQLFRAAGLDFEALKEAAQRRDFKPVPLNSTLSAHYAVKPETIVSHNVLGRLPGNGHPDETVIYSGHWDHLGIGQPDARGDRVYNGTPDKTSGLAIGGGSCRERREQ